MVIKDVHKVGGHTPDPEAIAKEVAEGPPQVDIVAKVQKAAAEGAAMRSFMEASGLQPSGTAGQQQRAEEKFGLTLDVAKLMESQSAVTNTLLTQLTSMMQHNLSAQQNTQLQEVQRGLQEIREGLRGTPADPVQSLLDNQEKLMKVMDLMKGPAGVPAQIPLGHSATDFATVLELTKLQMAQQEAQRRWEEERLERQHHYEAERMKWQQDFQIRLLELQDSRARKDQATDMFSSIATAIASGLDTKGAPAQVAARAPAMSPAPVPKAFPCQVCGAVLKVSDPQAAGVVCDSCRAEYTFTEQEGEPPEHGDT